MMTMMMMMTMMAIKNDHDDHADHYDYDDHDAYDTHGGHYDHDKRDGHDKHDGHGDNDYDHPTLRPKRHKTVGPHMGVGAEGQEHPLHPLLVHPHHGQWLQPLEQAVPPVPAGEMVHLLPGGGRHPQQEAGDLQQL